MRNIIQACMCVYIVSPDYLQIIIICEFAYSPKFTTNPHINTWGTLACVQTQSSKKTWIAQYEFQLPS